MLPPHNPFLLYVLPPATDCNGYVDRLCVGGIYCLFPKEATEIAGGDRLVAVNGIPLSSVSLKEWIETSTASVSTTGKSASSSAPDVGRYLVHTPAINSILINMGAVSATAACIDFFFLLTMLARGRCCVAQEGGEGRLYI